MWTAPDPDMIIIHLPANNLPLHDIKNTSRTQKAARLLPGLTAGQKAVTLFFTTVQDKCASHLWGNSGSFYQTNSQSCNIIIILFQI